MAEERSTYILQRRTCQRSAELHDNASSVREVGYLLSVTPNGPNVSGIFTARDGGDGGQSTYNLRHQIGRASARSTWHIILVSEKHATYSLEGQIGQMSEGCAWRKWRE